MNHQPCEQYTEWMSLAQDGMLSSTQHRLLHAHLAECPSCTAQWEAMTLVSQIFHAAPMATPRAGFSARFEARLAYRQEQRRQVIIWLLLGIGVIALITLAMPSLISVLCVTGKLVLPYQVITYVQGIVNWTYIVIDAFVHAAWVLIRYFVTQRAGVALIATVAATGMLILCWTRVLVGRMAAQKTQ